MNGILGNGPAANRRRRRVTNTKYVRYVTREIESRARARDFRRGRFRWCLSRETNAGYSGGGAGVSINETAAATSRDGRLRLAEARARDGGEDGWAGWGKRPVLLAGFHAYWHIRNLLSASFPEIADLPGEHSSTPTSRLTRRRRRRLQGEPTGSLRGNSFAALRRDSFRKFTALVVRAVT